MVSGLLSMLAKLDHPSEGLTIAIDMCLIFRYGRVPGPELTRSKAGTDLLERYITAQRVDDDLGLVLGCLPVPASARQRAGHGHRPVQRQAGYRDGPPDDRGR